MNYSIENKKEGIEFRAGLLQILIGSEGNVDFSFIGEKSYISPTNNISQTLGPVPFFYLVGEDIIVDKFRVLSDAVTIEKVIEFFGPGVHCRVPFVDSTSLNYSVHCELTFEIYEQFPFSVFMRYNFFLATHAKSIKLKQIIINRTRIDARKLGGSASHDMWVYNGSGETREHCLQYLTKDYYKKNYLGVPESYDGGGSDLSYRRGTQPGFGGGVPITDVWSHGFGISLGHSELRHKPVNMPVWVDEDGFVRVEIHQPLREDLNPANPLQSINTFLILHEGDFFNGLETYRKIMNASGMVFPEATRDAYEPLWDTWGFREDFTKEDIYDIVPHLKEMGIYWITLDDRWYDNTGDWMPRKDMFPGGEKDFIEFIENLHKQGMFVKLWTLPGEVDADPDLNAWLEEHPRAKIEIDKHPYHSLSNIYKEQPHWVVLAPDGRPELSKRGNYFSCGSLPGVLKHYYDVTVKMFRDWKIDGLKQDAIYICPACYDETHHHRNPDESSEMYGEIMRVIYEAARKYNPYAVIMSCPCGTPMTPDWIQWQNQPITMDPWTSWVNRGTVKSLKGLIGPRSAVVLDHVELSDEGSDFSTIGVGGVPETRFLPDGTEGGNVSEKPMSFNEKMNHWGRWINLYREHMLACGEYLNLYDFIYDTPEIHVVRKGSSIYYGIYPGEPDGIVADKGKLYNEKKHTKQYDGTIELRGLATDRLYSIYDYENNIDLGIVDGSNPYITVRIQHHLLIKVDAVSP